MASRSSQFSYDTYDVFSDDDDYWMLESVAATTPGWIDRAARLLKAPRLHLNSTPELPQIWGQVNPNLNDYHSDPMVISSTFWVSDTTDWWHQQETTDSKDTDLSNVARDIFSIIPPAVRVEASCAIGRDVINWWLLKTTGETLRETVFVWQFALANIEIVAGDDDPALNTTNTENNLEIKRMVIAQNGQGPQPFGDEAGQPKPTCYTAGIWCSTQANDSCRIHFSYRRDRQSSLVKVSTWWCGCV